MGQLDHQGFQMLCKNLSERNTGKTKGADFCGWTEQAKNTHRLYTAYIKLQRKDRHKGTDKNEWETKTERLAGKVQIENVKERKRKKDTEIEKTNSNRKTGKKKRTGERMYKKLTTDKKTGFEIKDKTK